MEAIFVNTENSKISEPHKIKFDLTDKHNFKNPNKKMVLANLSNHYTSSQNTTTINLKFQFQPGMILLNYLMVLVLLAIFKTTLNLSSKNMKL